MDPTKRHTDPIEETQQQYHLNELSELLDAPVAKIRLWLQDEGVGPVSEDQPDIYEADALEVLRGRDQMI